MNYKEEPEWEKKVAEMTGGEGVDFVVDVSVLCNRFACGKDCCNGAGRKVWKCWAAGAAQWSSVAVVR